MIYMKILPKMLNKYIQDLSTDKSLIIWKQKDLSFSQFQKHSPEMLFSKIKISMNYALHQATEFKETVY
jgi:hypothetical protein